MDIKKARVVAMVNEKYGLAVWDKKDTGYGAHSSVHFLIKQTRRDGSTWYQMTPGWYVSTLLENGIISFDESNKNEPGLYIDFGADWFIPRESYAQLQAVLNATSGEGRQLTMLDSLLVSTITAQEF